MAHSSVSDAKIIIMIRYDPNKHAALVSLSRLSSQVGGLSQQHDPYTHPDNSGLTTLLLPATTQTPAITLTAPPSPSDIVWIPQERCTIHTPEMRVVFEEITQL